jgi:ribosomal protein L13E
MICWFGRASSRRGREQSEEWKARELARTVFVGKRATKAPRLHPLNHEGVGARLGRGQDLGELGHCDLHRDVARVQPCDDL